MNIQDRLYTAQDLWTLSEEGQHYELFKGVLSEMSPTGSAHGRITAELTYLIMAFARTNNLGLAYGAETGFILAQDTVLALAIAFTTKARLGAASEGFESTLPDLVVEVASKNNTKIELYDKAMAYFEAGVQLVWIVYPKSKTVAVYHTQRDVTILGMDDMLTGGSVLSGFAVKLADIFAVLN